MINIYFVNSINKDSIFPLGGLAYVSNKTGYVMMTNGATNSVSTTLSHELGHIFGLRHTHGPSNDVRTKELVNGSNCTSEGDLLCDTPADPYLWNRVNQNCEFPYIIQDANGDVFVPDTRNIMSYSHCSLYFSQQQLARVNTIHHLYWQDLECTTFKADFEADVQQSCKTVSYTHLTLPTTPYV